ncbi:MAG: response regulator [Candidatus Binatia bacterium]
MKKILIIEDSRTVATMMSAVLKGGGFDVKTAEKGNDGFTQAKDWKPDLILLDVLLPDANGFDLLEKFKSDESCKDIPVLILTSRDSPDDVRKGLKLGANDYLVKHHTMPKLLVEKVKKWLG